MTESSHTYKLMSVDDVQGNVWLKSTDSQELNWILAELKKFIPSYRVNTTEKLISGEAYYYAIDKLAGKDEAVMWWIMQQLCLRGWEPFESATGGGDYHFRRKG